MVKRKMHEKKGNDKSDPKSYESYNYGSFKLERIGRMVRIISNWKPEQLEKHIEDVRSKRPELKEEINEKICKLLSLIDQFEPLELLSTVSLRNCFANSEEYKEITHEGKESYVEYAQSLILSQKRKTGVKPPTKEAIEQFNSLIADIYTDVFWYFGSEAAEGKRSKTEEKLRFMSILRYLFIRGDSYPEHHLEMIKDIFRDHDIFFKKHYGFDSNEVIMGIQQILEQLLNNIQQQTKFVSLVHELHELFKEFVNKESKDTFSSLEDCMKRYLALPNVQQKKKKLEKLQNTIDGHPFEIVSTEKVPIDLLELLSSRFGDNSAFLTFESSPAWPTNDSIIYDRPLIEDDGRFYCFAPQVLFRNIGNILEGWIKQKDSDYYQKSYQKKRTVYLEAKSLEYLKNIFPDAKIFGNLFYCTKENGEEKRVETDGLIIYDEHLFIIEAKVSTLSISARRGGLERMKSDLAKIVKKAYEQALRTKKYIIKTPEPIFEFENGSTALIIEDKAKYRNIHLLNITLENLGLLSTHLGHLKNLDLIRGKEWPWSVFINDLRIISELIEFPSEFLLFLQRRIRANDYPQFRTFDELDFLIFYFNEGLYFEDGDLQNIQVYPVGYTEDLDRYYDFVAGRVSNGKKPQLQICKDYKTLITGLESTGKDGFTKVTTTLLSLDSENQQMILDNLKKAKDAVESDGKDHSFTMVFNDVKMGLTFSVNKKKKRDFWDRSDFYCKMKMYQTRSDEWIVVTVDLNNARTRTLEFKVYRKKWEFDPDMEELLKRFKKQIASVKLLYKEEATDISNEGEKD